jgi:hypothetical protein
MLIFLIVAILGINNIATQQSISDTEKLVYFLKIYGLLKYYYPQVAAGNFN